MKELILTEKSNPNSKNIDLESTSGILRIINNEDKLVAIVVEKELEVISKAVDLISESFLAGGSLLYFGAGTSGRLGVLDASECPPTFGVNKNMVRGYIAGGDKALREAVEGAEDIYEDGERDLIMSAVGPDDVVAGISASGNAPYICGVLSKAKELLISTVAISCNKKAKIGEIADIHIAPEVGSEVVTGSTRLKAGTAQKMVLNMLTTASMIKTGKTYHNYMIDVMPTNKKLVDRATRIIVDLTGVSYDIAGEYLIKADNSVKVATVMIKSGVDKDQAKQLILQNNGILRKVIG
ncbi:MAG: N-acetylmuramic acid 6-phosphate etherase [Cyanobacteriota bacterium]